MLLTDFKVTTDSGAEPVTINDVKQFLKIDFENDDDLIASLIVSARNWCEKYTSRTFIAKTVTGHFEGDGNDGKINLPYPPIDSVTSVTRVRQDESTALTVNTDYYLMGVQDKYIDINTSTVNYVTPGTSPNDNVQAWNIEVIYVAGYGYERSDVPSAIKSAITRLTSYLYENRDEVEVGTIIAKVPFGVKSLLEPYKVLHI